LLLLALLLLLLLLLLLPLLHLALSDCHLDSSVSSISVVAPATQRLMVMTVPVVVAGMIMIL
jgi:hypothetical protein